TDASIATNGLVPRRRAVGFVESCMCPPGDPSIKNIYVYQSGVVKVNRCRIPVGKLRAMVEPALGPVKRLPRGPHGLPREEVERSQRERLLTAAAEAVAEKGYASMSVADILKGASVSRTTFYQLFDDKLDCFLAACR